MIGLEVHAELQTRSKMFCACPVVDSTQAAPNTAVCPVCAGMPGSLPVPNRQAVEFGLRVALALHCQVPSTSIFARKNYFYPDLPKGYQISQYESPLAVNGRLEIPTSSGIREIRIRRVHLEEDTGKLTHIHDGQDYSLVDLNRAGIPLLEIVSEPDLRSPAEARSYAEALRLLLRYLGVNSGDMQKGVIRFEANVSIRSRGSTELGTRVEIKNLNSFRALERSIAYEISRQTRLVGQGQPVLQETLGWDDVLGETLSQRSKEEAHDYRYFPEPDLPPLVVSPEWIERVRAALPELPQARQRRLSEQYHLSPQEAAILIEEPTLADYFEQAASASPRVAPKTIANWMLSELFSLMNQAGSSSPDIPVGPLALVDLLERLERGDINPPGARLVLAEMFATGHPAEQIIAERGLRQVSEAEPISEHIAAILNDHPQEVAAYLAGKETLFNWFFGQAMRRAEHLANPQVVRRELQRQLDALRPHD